MSPQEHEFMLFLFLRHELLISRIVGVLKNKTNLSTLEKKAWDDLLSGLSLEPGYQDEMRKKYVQLAHQFGIEIPTDTAAGRK